MRLRKQSQLCWGHVCSVPVRASRETPHGVTTSQGMAARPNLRSGRGPDRAKQTQFRRGAKQTQFTVSGRWWARPTPAMRTTSRQTNPISRVCPLGAEGLPCKTKPIRQRPTVRNKANLGVTGGELRDDLAKQSQLGGVSADQMAWSRETKPIGRIPTVQNKANLSCRARWSVPVRASRGAPYGVTTSGANSLADRDLSYETKPIWTCPPPGRRGRSDGVTKAVGTVGVATG